MADDTVERISAEDAKVLLDAGDAVAVDVREPRELAVTGKVRGALNIPVGTVTEWGGSVMPDPRLDPDQTVILYCGAGARAHKAGLKLKALGFRDVRNMGGFNDWDQENFPVEAG